MADHIHHTTSDGTLVASMPSTSDQAAARAQSLSSALAGMSRARSLREEPTPFIAEPGDDIATEPDGRRGLFSFAARARAAVTTAPDGYES